MKIDKQGRAYKPGVVMRLIGQRFGALTVIDRAGNCGKFAAWKCRCECGSEVVVSGDKLRRGKRKACGVNGHRWKSEQVRPQGGMTVQFPSEYRSWVSMHDRCKEPQHKNYK